MIERMIGEADYEHLLKSWVYLDNHDTERLHTVLPDQAQRRVAQVLQFTLPGAPNLYYGTEVAMIGGDDPAMRAPMRWDRVADNHPELDWTRQLIQLHQQHRALRVGNFRTLTTDRLLGFERHTDRVADTVIVLANPTDKDITETVLIANSKLMNPSKLRDLLPTAADPATVNSALVSLTVPANSVRVLSPDTSLDRGYTPYKRVR
jgi:cyclomaltodextrinase